MAALASSTPAAPATGFGDITVAVDALRDAATDLGKAYEDDVSAYALAEAAGSIRFRASQLEDVFNQVGAALQNLTS